MRQAVSILAVAALAGGPLTSAQLSWVRGTSDTLRINVTVAAQSSGPHPRSPSPPIVDAAPLVYSLALGPGEPWLESAPVSVFAGSTWYTSGTISTALILAGTASESAGTDPALGQFDALTIPWRYGPSSSPSRFNTTIKYYSELGAVAFEQAFVDGISHVGTLEQPPLAGRGCETGINTTTLPLAEFPAFRSGPGTRLSELGYTTWAGTCCWRLRVGGGVGLGGFMGGAEGGPLTLFDANQTASGGKADAMVLSPLDSFMHNVISLRNARTTTSGAAPTGDGNTLELKQNWDNGGHDLIEGSSKAPNVQACEQRCRLDTSCAAFSYEELAPSTCFLKSSAARSPVHEHGPSAHHTSGVMKRTGSVLAVGPSGQLQEIPRGHVSTFVVVGVRQQGIHSAMRAWGRAVRQKYNTTRNTAGDVVTNKLGL
jgi:hypothetical protein